MQFISLTKITDVRSAVTYSANLPLNFMRLYSPNYFCTEKVIETPQG